MATLTATDQVIANAATLPAVVVNALTITTKGRNRVLQIARTVAGADLHIHPQALADCDELTIENSAQQVRLFLALPPQAVSPLRLKVASTRKAMAQLFLAAHECRTDLQCSMRLEQDSQLDCFLSIHNSTSNITVDAEVYSHVQARFFGLTRAARDNNVTIGMHVHHREGKNYTEQKFYSYASDQSSITFTGKISVSPGAGESVAHQLHRGTVLSREARISAQPFLNIMHDDVRCTHGSTVGFIDADARRYLMARGMAAEDAEQILIGSSQRQFIDALPEAGAVFFALQGGDE